MNSATKDASTDAEDWVPETLPIPSHWVYAGFEDAFENVPLTGLKIPQKDYSQSGAFPVIDQGDGLIGGHTDDANKVVKRDRSLVVFGDHTKCFKFVNFPFAPGADGVKVLVPRRPIYERFAYYACKSLRLPDRGYSRHYSFLKRSAFPLAPVNEQVRIVDKLEELFSELDKGIESLKKARDQLKVFRQAVLKQAFEGKLTEQWRKENEDTLESTDEFLARIKQEREAHDKKHLEEWQGAVKTWEEQGQQRKKPSKPRAPKKLSSLSHPELASLPKLPNNWAYIRLGDVIDEPKYGTSKKCDYDIDGVGVLRIPNIANGLVDDDDLKFAQFDQDEIQSYGLIRGDILTIRSNGSISLVGKCALIKEMEERYLYAGYLIRLRSIEQLVLPEYLISLLSGHLLRVQIEAKAKSTSGVHNINSGELQNLIVPVCGAAEQQELISVLAGILSSIEATEVEVDEQILHSEALRQSILKRAFSGQIVARDPNDEPASSLLQRIKAEKSAQSKQSKRKTKKGKQAA